MNAEENEKLIVAVKDRDFKKMKTILTLHKNAHLLKAINVWIIKDNLIDSAVCNEDFPLIKFIVELNQDETCNRDIWQYDIFARDIKFVKFMFLQVQNVCFLKLPDVQDAYLEIKRKRENFGKVLNTEMDNKVKEYVEGQKEVEGTEASMKLRERLRNHLSLLKERSTLIPTLQEDVQMFALHCYNYGHLAGHYPNLI